MSQQPMICGHLQTLPEVVSDFPWYDVCGPDDDGLSRAYIEPPFYHGQNEKPYDPKICRECNRKRTTG